MKELTPGQVRPIAGSVALVTGANRGLGAAYARELLGRGAAKVYAAVRDPATITDPRLLAVQMDITDRRSIARAASQAHDVTLVINNAGVLTGTATLGEEAGLRQELEVNYLGPVAVTRAFAPILGANGGGALVNVLSVLSWLSFPGSGGYSSAKAAMWAATNSLRQILLGQGTLVTAVHVAYIDTDMSASVTSPEPALTAWVRLREDDHPPGTRRLILLMDALAPSYAAILSTLVPIPTVELTIRPNQNLARASSPWVLLHAQTRAASADGWIDEEIQAWGPDGAHLGSAQQLRLMRAPSGRR
jgi:NAD(P)-dependent dehydrogenase (short-subunit alcohol dehydrogenase family)